MFLCLCVRVCLRVWHIGVLISPVTTGEVTYTYTYTYTSTSCCWSQGPPLSPGWISFFDMFRFHVAGERGTPSKKPIHWGLCFPRGGFPAQKWRNHTWNATNSSFRVQLSETTLFCRTKPLKPRKKRSSCRFLSFPAASWNRYMSERTVRKKVRKKTPPGRGVFLRSTYTYTYAYTKIYISMHIRVHIHTRIHIDIDIHVHTSWIHLPNNYGAATMSRMLKNICLFAEYRSLL